MGMSARGGRGARHRCVTVRAGLLQALLDLPVPTWHHHALLVEANGKKLAKRRGSPSLADRRRAGEDGLAIANALRRGNLPTGISLAEGVNSAP